MSLQVGKIKGIKIRLHFTLIVVFALLSWTISAHFMPQYVPGLEQVDYWILGVTSTGLLFVAILLHELSHSLMSKRYGIPVRSITLFIFGGISDISREPKSAHKEFTISIVGPITSFVIAGVFAAMLFAINGIEFTSFEDIQLTKVGSILFYGVLVNFLLGVFNLIPAFPLDGGRILRSVLFRIRGNFYEATKISTTIGVIFSYLFMAFGAVSLFSGNILGGIWILIIGWFLNTGVKSYQYYFEMKNLLKGVLAKDVMNTQIITINKSQSIERSLEALRMHLKSELPVVDDEGILLGMIKNKDALKVEDAQREIVSVQDAMTPKN
ncbi:MAG: site-2 protease family protein, partial [Nitrosopumilaceae archaeon]